MESRFLCKSFAIANGGVRLVAKLPVPSYSTLGTVHEIWKRRSGGFHGNLSEPLAILIFLSSLIFAFVLYAII